VTSSSRSSLQTTSASTAIPHHHLRPANRTEQNRAESRGKTSTTGMIMMGLKVINDCVRLLVRLRHVQVNVQVVTLRAANRARRGLETDFRTNSSFYFRPKRYSIGSGDRLNWGDPMRFRRYSHHVIRTNGLRLYLRMRMRTERLSC
jgi:hypothetical protein